MLWGVTMAPSQPGKTWENKEPENIFLEFVFTPFVELTCFAYFWPKPVSDYSCIERICTMWVELFTAGEIVKKDCHTMFHGCKCVGEKRKKKVFLLVLVKSMVKGNKAELF